MPIRVQLIEERELEINVDPEDWQKAFNRAVESNQMIQIRNADGEILGINPHQILFWVAIPDSASQLTLDQQATPA